MSTDEPAATAGDTLFFLAIIVIAAIDQIFPGTYFPSLETNQMRTASENPSVCPDDKITLRHVSLSSAYVANTIRVASAIHPHCGLIDCSLSPASAHCPLSAAAAYHTIAIARSHCAATNRLRRALANRFPVDVGVAGSGISGRKLLESDSSTKCRHFTGTLRKFQHSVEGKSELSGVSGSYEYSCFIVLDHIGETS